ncbi:MAG: hypothetical protein AB8G96_06675 [Phycisphaerales bacterium]
MASGPSARDRGGDLALQVTAAGGVRGLAAGAGEATVQLVAIPLARPGPGPPSTYFS